MARELEHRTATVTVNGKEVALAAASVSGLLEQLGYGGERPAIAVALNGRVVPRGRWAEQALAHGDEIEIVGAVQGG